MAGNLCITLTQSSPFSPKLYSSKPLLQKSHRICIAPLTPFLKFQDSAASQASTRGFTTICFSSPRNGPDYKVSIINFKLALRVVFFFFCKNVVVVFVDCGVDLVTVFILGGSNCAM